MLLHSLEPGRPVRTQQKVHPAATAFTKLAVSKPPELDTYRLFLQESQGQETKSDGSQDGRRTSIKKSLVMSRTGVTAQRPARYAGKENRESDALSILNRNILHLYHETCGLLSLFLFLALLGKNSRVPKKQASDSTMTNKPSTWSQCGATVGTEATRRAPSLLKGQLPLSSDKWLPCGPWVARSSDFSRIDENIDSCHHYQCLNVGIIFKKHSGRTKKTRLAYKHPIFPSRPLKVCQCSEF